MGVRIPTGTRQSDLSAPIPGTDQTQNAVAGATEQLGQLDRAPAAVTSQDLPPDAPAQGGISPEEQAALAQADALSAEEQGLLAQADSMGQAALQQPPLAGPYAPTRETSLSGIPISFLGKLVKKPDNTIGILEDGKVRDLTESEKADANVLSKMLQFGTPIVAGFGAGVAGGGPVAATAAGIATSEFVQQPASELAQASMGGTEGLPDRTHMQRGLEAALGVGGGKLMASFAKTGLQRVSPVPDVASEIATLTGAQSAARLAEERAASVKGFKGPVFPEQINMENPATVKMAEDIQAGVYGSDLAVKRQFQQLAQREAIKDETTRLIEQFPELNEANIAQYGPSKVVNDLVTELPVEIAVNKGKIYEAGEGRIFPVDDLQRSFQEVLENNNIKHWDQIHGKKLTEAKQDMLNLYETFAEAVQGNKGSISMLSGQPEPTGFSMQQLDDFTTKLQKAANFDSPIRSPLEKEFGELAYKARIARDTAAELAVAKTDPTLAGKLRESRLAFQEKYQSVKQYEKVLANDPENFTRALIKKDAPNIAKAVVKSLPEESVGLIRRQLIENAIQDTDIISKGLNATKAEKAFLSYGDETLTHVYGKEGVAEIKTFFNRMKVLEARNFKTVGEMEKNAVAQSMVKNAAAGKGGGIIRDFVEWGARLSRRNSVQRQYFERKLGHPAPDSAEVLLKTAGGSLESKAKVDRNANFTKLGTLLQGAPPATAAVVGSKTVQELYDAIAGKENERIKAGKEY